MSVESSSFCRFCIALCGIRVAIDGERIVSVKGDPEHPASRGYTCAKGRSLGRWHHHPGRILAPRVRRDTGWAESTWTEIHADIAQRIRSIIEAHGADSVGVYIGTAASLDGAGKWAAERFARVIGTRSKYSAISIDTPCKPLVSLLMSGYSGLVPVIDDRRCTMTVFIGSNPVVSHGHLNGFPNPVVRLRDMAESPKELWVIDSRVTESSRLATRALMPRPGTDFAVIAFLVRELLLGGGCDEQYVANHVDPEDLGLLRQIVDEWTDVRTSNVTGCPMSELRELLGAVRRHRHVSFQTGTGTTMASTANLTEWLVWVLHVITGSYDAPGGMWFHPGFLRRVDVEIEPNEELPTPGPGPASRPELATWNDEYPCAALVDEIEAGNLRVLVVFGGNPMTAFPDPERTAMALGKLDALVVLDVVDTETTELATHVLPTKGQLERADLPFYYDQFNLDYSTQFTPSVVKSVGESRSMWRITAEMANGVGAEILPQPLSVASSDEDVLEVLASRADTSFDEIRREKYVLREPVFGWVRERVLPKGRWRLTPIEFVSQLSRWKALVPPPGLLVTSRRQFRQLNSQKPAVAGSGIDAPVAIIHSDTAARHGIVAGDRVDVTNAHGSVTTSVVLTDDVHPDVVSLTHGWRDANVSYLTSESFVDELTGMVVQTGMPVTIHRR